MKKLIALAVAISTLFTILFCFSGCEVAVRPIQNVAITDNVTKLSLKEDLPATGKDTLKIELAKNEREGAQFVLRFDETVKNVSVTASSVVNENGEKLEVYGLYKEHYLPCAGVYYPDALVPLSYDIANSFDINGGENQGIWITLAASKTQTAGIYHGTVTVTHDGGIIEIPLEAEVWNFEIPTRPSMQTSYELWFSTVWTLMNYNGATEGVDYYDMLQEYYWFLADYRLCALSIPEAYSSPEEFAELAAKYMADERVSTYRIPGSQHNHDENGVLRPDLQAYIDALDAKGILEKGIIYTYDEPTFDYYNSIIADYTAVKNYNSRARNLLTVSPRTTLYNYVDVWCGVWNTSNNIEEFVRERQDAGDNVWWYECNFKPEPSYHFSGPTIGARIIDWFQRDRAIEGCLYWGSAISTAWTRELGWNAHRDIWADGKTMYNEDGDGFLIYAGTRNDGVINDNAPIPSIRLETARDGQEDYEYLCLMEKKVEQIIEKYGLTDISVDTYMDTYYDAVYNNLSDYTKDGEVFHGVRAQLAHDIMASDDVLVASLIAIEPDNANMREIRVYAPTDAVVTINDATVTGADCGKYGLFSRTFDMNILPDFSVIEVSVNGEIYKKTIRPVSELAVRDLAYSLMRSDLEALGNPITPEQAQKSMTLNMFDFSTMDTENGNIETIIDCRSDLPKIETSIGDEMKNSIPCVMLTADCDFSNDAPTDLRQTLTFYVPLGATVSVNGENATLVANSEKYSEFTYEIALDTAGRHLVDVSVTANGITETFSKVVFRRSEHSYHMVDLSNENTQELLNSKKDMKIVNRDGENRIEMTFKDTSARGFQIPASALTDEAKNIGNGTTITFDITNTSNGLIILPKIDIVCGIAKDATPLYAMVSPGDTVTVTGQIAKDLKQNDIDALRFTYSWLPINPITIEISDIRIENTPYFYLGDSDYILMD